jgi:hypothetical protein
LKKNTIIISYIIIPLLIIILFGTSALCNRCISIKAGGNLAQKTDESQNGKTSDENVSETEQQNKESSPSEVTENVKEDGKTEKPGSAEATTETEESGESSGGEENSGTAEIGQDSEDQQEGSEAPTIKLEIYEGPAYSAEDDVCYYRVKATVTGTPVPDVTFSKDDSNGAWGGKKAQVNIRRGETYTLKATAKNSAGQANDSIMLVWGCGGQNNNPVIDGITYANDTFKTGQQYDLVCSASDPDGDALLYQWSSTGGAFNNISSNPVKWTAPQAEGDYRIGIAVSDSNGGRSDYLISVNVTNSIDGVDTSIKPIIVPKILSMDVPKEKELGGTAEQYNLCWTPRSIIYAGDSGQVTYNGSEFECRGFIYFNISGLAGRTITGASVTFRIKEKHGTPRGNSLWVSSVDWGPHGIVGTDFYLDRYAIEGFAIENEGNFTCSNNKLLAQLQNYIDSGKQYFQLRIQWSNFGTDNDRQLDGWEYDPSGIIMKVTYY